MAIEVNSVNAVCGKCGTGYSRQKGYFPVSYATLHKGVGHTHVCKECIDNMYNSYFAECKSAPDAVRQVCRKLDLYWSEKVYKVVERKSTTRSMMTQYIAKINSVTYAGKSYDETLREEGTLWDFGVPQQSEDSIQNNGKVSSINTETENESASDLSTIPPDVISFWGRGYSADMYKDLEERRQYWMSHFPKDIELSVGTEALIRQICSLELDINRDRAAGRPTDRNVNILNTLLGSASLKPAQIKDDADADLEKMPLGVGIQKWEFHRPLPETPKPLRDVRETIKNITTWYLGHACKMVGLKNSYCKMYEDAMERLRVKSPEINEDEDEDFLNDLFRTDTTDEGSS